MAKFIYTTQGGRDIELKLPTMKAVCSRCDGYGKHSNPSIDGNGITAEEWSQDWDEESREAYMEGRYDVTCEECNGANVVDVVDEKRLSKRQWLYYELWYEQQEQHAQWEADDRITRYYENGGHW